MKNNIKLDISFLSNSYNLVSAISTFFLASVKLNDKLKFLWEYDLQIKTPKKFLDSNKLYFYNTIYNMNSTQNYKKMIHPWFNSPRQRKMMIKEKCIYNFDIIRQ